MQHRIKKIRISILTLVFLGVASGAVFWMSYTISQYGNTLSEQMAIVAQNNEFKEQSATLSNVIAETEDERATLDRYVLNDEQDTITLLSKLDEVAVARGVELETTKLEEKEESGSFNTLLLGYTFSGSETGVMSMLQIFESLPYHGNITNFSIERNTDMSTGRTSAIAKISLALTIKKYD